MLYDISWCYGEFWNQMWNPFLWNYYFHNLFMLSLQNTIYNNWRTETKRGESFNGISRVGKYTNISEHYGWTLTSIGSHAADFASKNVYLALQPWGENVKVKVVACCCERSLVEDMFQRRVFYVGDNWSKMVVWIDFI